LIEIRDLSVHYDGRRALDGVSLEVQQGELFGILGPNGAGKTTLFSVLSGHKRPSQGGARIQGLDPVTQAHRVQSILGIVPQEFAGYEVLSALENLEFFGAMHRLRGRRLTARTRELLGMVSLQSRARDPVKAYSGGMKRRLNIILGLIHQPRVVIMDEPTTGLDPLAREELWRIIRGLKRAGVTVLLTTHYMQEAEALCDRVAILDRGKVRVLGSPRELGGNLEEVFRSTVTLGDMVTPEGEPVGRSQKVGEAKVRLKRAGRVAPEGQEEEGAR
jgi:ABC-2 type transport system ATP-binding protein